jgi:TonB dependent receptor
MAPSTPHVLSLALSLALPSLTTVHPAAASADSATVDADSGAKADAETETQKDGFGARIGEERIGLYGEDQVRGFALEDAGNDRIDGLYFVRTRAPSNAVLSGSNTRVGLNALRYDFPAASGIVDYALRTPETDSPARTAFGWRGYSGPFLDHYFGAMGASQRWGFARALVANDGAPSRRSDSRWLYDASLLLPVGERVTLFAAAVRSLEETGAAPQNARNRNAILPPVLATQREAGLQWSITNDLTLIANAFDLRKALPGVDASGVYRVIGQARHRGVELSLAGGIGERFDVNVGALLMRPRVDGGGDAEAGDEPVGRSARVAVTTLNWKPARMPGTVFDLVATYNGPRWADRANTVNTPGYAVFDLGLRRDVRIAGLDALFRLRLRNIGDRYAWFATPSGLQFYNRERAVDARMEVKW